MLVRDSPVAQNTGNFASLLRDVASQVEARLAGEFDRKDFPSKFAPMYANMLVGMVALTGQWWLDVRKPKKDEVVAHVVNLAWNGIVGLEKKPQLITNRSRRQGLTRCATPALATARLDLEPLRVEHADEMVDLLADRALYAFYADEASPTLDELRERYARQVRGALGRTAREIWHNWILRERADGRGASASSRPR